MYYLFAAAIFTFIATKNWTSAAILLIFTEGK